MTVLKLLVDDATVQRRSFKTKTSESMQLQLTVRNVYAVATVTAGSLAAPRHVRLQCSVCLADSNLAQYDYILAIIYASLTFSVEHALV
jgi:hypothetical protein